MKGDKSPCATKGCGHNYLRHAGKGAYCLTPDCSCGGFK